LTIYNIWYYAGTKENRIMTQLSEIDWDTVRLQYEVLGYSLSYLSEAYDIPEALLKYHSAKWEPMTQAMRDALGFAKTDDYGRFYDATEDQIRKEFETVSLVKQRDIFKKYLILERVLLNKSIAIANGLEIDSSSINHISRLLDTLHQLISKNPLIAQKDAEVEGEDVSTKKVEVNIVHTTADQTECASETGAISIKEEEV
jgi:hypothetical protein